MEIGKTVEVLIVEVDQQNYKEYLSTKSANPIKPQRYHRENTRVMDANDEVIPIQ